MRRTLIAALATLGVGAILLTGPGPKGQAQSAFMGAPPHAIQNKPINLNNMVGNLNTQGMFHTHKPSSPLNLTNMFHKPPQPSWPPKVAATPQINPTKNPLQNVPAKSQFVINPSAPAPGSKTIWDFPFNPFAKKTPQKK